MGFVVYNFRWQNLLTCLLSARRAVAMLKLMLDIRPNDPPNWRRIFTYEFFSTALISRGINKVIFNGEFIQTRVAKGQGMFILMLRRSRNVYIIWLVNK